MPRTACCATGSWCATCASTAPGSCRPDRQTAYEAFPAEEEPADPALFAHGSRLRRREVALVFDAVDAVEGLASILSTLEEYGIRATFFVNGEAVRRYPDAVREIAEAGHEVGSLFFTHFNMTDARFQVDGEFIKHGLARAEDEYHAVTGRELALLWHAPLLPRQLPDRRGGPGAELHLRQPGRGHPGLGHRGPGQGGAGHLFPGRRAGGADRGQEEARLHPAGPDGQARRGCARITCSRSSTCCWTPCSPWGTPWCRCRA